MRGLPRAGARERRARVLVFRAVDARAQARRRGPARKADTAGPQPHAARARAPDVQRVPRRVGADVRLCHTSFDPSPRQWDFAAGKETAGAWVERSEGFSWAPPLLGVRADGQIVPAHPEWSSTSTDGGRGGEARAAAPRARRTHTTGRKARTCESCHRAPPQPEFEAGTRTGFRGLNAAEKKRVAEARARQSLNGKRNESFQTVPGRETSRRAMKRSVSPLLPFFLLSKKSLLWPASCNGESQASNRSSGEEMAQSRREFIRIGGAGAPRPPPAPASPRTGGASIPTSSTTPARTATGSSRRSASSASGSAASSRT